MGREVRMGNPTGYRRGTRDMFSRAYKRKGVEHLSTYLTTYKMGDIVDIKGNGAFLKGMPHKAYHGKTGRVFNVSKRACGVVVNKRVGGKILPKRIYVRVEHLKHSQCRKDFLDRGHANEGKKQEAKTTGRRARPARGCPRPPRRRTWCPPRTTSPRSSDPSPSSSWPSASTSAVLAIIADSWARASPPVFQ